MQLLMNIDSDLKTPKYLQIVNSIIESIRCGKLKKGDPILSINELSDEYLLSRDTVQKAYLILRKQGIIVSVRGKGFYIKRTDVATPYRILLLFNKISNYKRQIYNAFCHTIGDNAVVDLKIHHYNSKIFESLVINNLHDYDYYVIMPHFYEQQELADATIKKIPADKLIILDKDINNYHHKYAGVYQDFKNDIYEALESGLDLLKKYNKLVLVHPKIIPYPAEIKTGFRFFCSHHNFTFDTIHEIESDRGVKSGEAYIVIEETDLVNLIKICRSTSLEIGKDVGIISYNETPLKEILLDGITVISTDHVKMGEIAATLILDNRKEKVKNPFLMIRRKSL
jgi:DNA-binding transcriptional regulator YhcF (GntR family)